MIKWIPSNDPYREGEYTPVYVNSNSNANANEETLPKYFERLGRKPSLFNLTANYPSSKINSRWREHYWSSEQKSQKNINRREESIARNRALRNATLRRYTNKVRGHNLTRKNVINNKRFSNWLNEPRQNDSRLKWLNAHKNNNVSNNTRKIRKLIRNNLRRKLYTEKPKLIINVKKI